MSSSDPLTSFPTTPRPSSRISPSFGNLGFFQCCGLPARTPHLASSMLRASPHPSFGNLGFFRCCGLPPRTSFQALIRESWRLPVLRATSPHPSFGNLGICQCCGLPARTSFQARLGFFQCCGLPARTPHSGILASSSAAGCQPAPLIRESWLLPVLRAASPPAHTPHSGILASASAAGCTPAPLIWHLPCCGPARTPHLGILASSGAAGCHPAPPSKPSFGNVGVFQCCGLPARTSFQARLGFFQCSPHLPSPHSGIFASSSAAGGQPAPPSKPFGNLGFFRCCGPARTVFQCCDFQGLIWESLPAAPSKPSFGNLGFFQCCGLPPHLLPSPHSGILASSSAAHLLPRPHSGSLASSSAAGCQPARTSFQALIGESWLLPVLRAASPRHLPSPHSGILASSGAAGCQPAPIFASSSAAC